MLSYPHIKPLLSPHEDKWTLLDATANKYGAKMQTSPKQISV